MEDREVSIKDFMPLVEKLIWPVFIVIMIVSFRGEARDLYGILKKRLSEGASIKIGGFLELGEKASQTEIGQLGFANLRIEAIGGPAEAVSKESFGTLDRLRQEIKAAPNRRIDTLRVDDGKLYSPALLKGDPLSNVTSLSKICLICSCKLRRFALAISCKAEYTSSGTLRMLMDFNLIPPNMILL